MKSILNIGFIMPNKTMITFIQPNDLYELRLEILRKGMPIETVQFPNDFSIGTFHLGKYIENQLVGVVSFSHNKFSTNEFRDKNSYQLRGMAIEPAFQKQNIGMELCTVGENILKNIGINFIWCNARQSAEGFYEKLSYNKFGDYFHIENAEKHIIMYKHLM